MNNRQKEYLRAFRDGQNNKLIDDRKCVFFGDNRDIIIYPKACIANVSRGDASIIFGYTVIETFKENKKSNDGFVVASK